MGEKIYSLSVNGKRLDISIEQLHKIHKSTTTTEGGRKFVHIFTKDGRLDVLKEKFDDAIQKAEAMMGDGKMVVLVDDDPKGMYHCHSCNMYVPETGECTNVLGHIEPEGTCQLHVQGPTAKPDQINPFRMLKDEVGYDERDAGFGCTRCIRFEKPSTCKIIKDKVAWNMCCNYQFDGDTKKSDAIASKYAEEQKQLAKERLASTGNNAFELRQKVSKVKTEMINDTINKLNRRK